MWMLYGDQRGKQGAMLSFPGAVMKAILKLDTVKLGRFNKAKRFEGEIISQKNDDYEIFLTDVIYGDITKNGRLQINQYEDHEVIDKQIISNKDIFVKNYAWAYERECRLVIRLSRNLNSRAKKDGLNTICIPFTEVCYRRCENVVWSDHQFMMVE